MNVFHYLADICHAASKVILIWAIFSNKSAEGVSLLTQSLYLAIFTTRYADIAFVPPAFMWWNTILKIFYLTTSAYVVYMMMRVYTRTREKEYAFKLALWSVVGSLVTAPFTMLILSERFRWGFFEVGLLQGLSIFPTWHFQLTVPAVYMGLQH